MHAREIGRDRSQFTAAVGRVSVCDCVRVAGPTPSVARSILTTYHYSRRPSPRCRTARAGSMPSDTRTPARVVASNRVGTNTGQDPAAGDMAKSTPVKGHLQPRARLGQASRGPHRCLGHAARQPQRTVRSPEDSHDEHQAKPLKPGRWCNESSPSLRPRKPCEMLQETLCRDAPDDARAHSQPPAPTRERCPHAQPAPRMTECMAALMKQMAPAHGRDTRDSCDYSRDRGDGHTRAKDRVRPSACQAINRRAPANARACDQCSQSHQSSHPANTQRPPPQSPRRSQRWLDSPACRVALPTANVPVMPRPRLPPSLRRLSSNPPSSEQDAAQAMQRRSPPTPPSPMTTGRRVSSMGN